MQRTITYREQSRVSLAEAFEELAKGDLPQASEKGWGAASQMVKAVSAERGWSHGSHRDLYQVVSKLRLEIVNPKLTSLFSAATSLRVNASENWHTAQDVEDHLRRVDRFLSRLEKLLPASPKKTSKKPATPPSREQSKLLLAQAREELSKGYLVEASEKGWLAAFEMAKVIGRQRGWAHSTDREFYGIISALRNETGNSEWTNLISSAGNLRTNSVENWFDYCFIEFLLGNVERLVDRLEGLLEAAPNPATSPYLQPKGRYAPLSSLPLYPPASTIAPWSRPRFLPQFLRRWSANCLQGHFRTL